VLARSPDHGIGSPEHGFWTYVDYAELGILHVLRARLRGGVLSKAQRRELKVPLPTGLVCHAADRVVRDPERRVQAAIRLFQNLSTPMGQLRAG
jgi:hypothetical protein